MENDNPLNDNQSSKEKHAARRAEKAEEKMRNHKARAMKKFAQGLSFFLIIGGVVVFVIWSIATRPPIPEGEILSEKGLHWHAKLKIYIDGKEQEIPNNIGIGVTHNPIHTHDASGEIHLEFNGLVKKDDLRLEKLFALWGKDFSSTCIFDQCAADNKRVIMTVNGNENTEFEKYIMQDKDRIEIRYE